METMMTSSQMNRMEQIESLEDINQIKFQYDIQINTKQKLLADKLESEEKIKQIEYDVSVLEEVKTLLETLKNYKMDSKKEFILNTINAALQDVFEQNVRIDIEMNASNKSGASSITTRYDIVLYQNDIEISRNEKLLENNGGGVLSFISILFKILVGYIYSNSKFYLFDESLSQVSASYRPRLARFLRTFCETYNFTIILISHTDDIDEHAHVGYRLTGKFDRTGVPELGIADIFGTYPIDNYNYVKIKNFQSIVSLEFRYKGFTVIRGDNNIGKSASFRAINAIVFNTFNVDDFPRINRPRGAYTEIEFGYHKTDTDVAENAKNKIELIYKSGQKLVYLFDGEEYAGKSLAFEKIKEKVETLGFKYVNLKETYKNFKGNLKDQTERLAMTTQHDGLYMVGNKSNETEKVFNFLFDSSGVSNAIMCVNADNKELNDRYQILKSNVNKINLQLKQVDILIEKYNYLFYTTSIKNYFISLRNRDMILKIFTRYENVKKDLTSIISIMTNLETYKNQLFERTVIDKQVSDLNRVQNILNISIATTEQYILIRNQRDLILNFFSKVQERFNINSNIEKTQNNIYIVTQGINSIDVMNQILYHINTIKNFNKLIENRYQISESIKIVSDKVELMTSKLQQYSLLVDEKNSYTYYIDVIKKYFNLLSIRDNNISRVNNISSKINLLNDIMHNIQLIVNFRNQLDVLYKKYTSRSDINSNILNIETIIANLPKEFNICICPHCAGEGYINV